MTIGRPTGSCSSPGIAGDLEISGLATYSLPGGVTVGAGSLAVTVSTLPTAVTDQFTVGEQPDERVAAGRALRQPQRHRGRT